MFKIFLISYLWLFSFMTKAQSSPIIDSLLSSKAFQKEDTNKINILIEIHEQIPEKESEKKLNYINQALALARKLNEHEKLAQVYLSLGTYYTYRSNYENSLKYHLECAKIAEKHNISSFQIKAYLGVGQAFQKLDNKSPKAKIYYKKAENLAFDSKDSTMLSYIYVQNAFLHYFESKFDSTLFYHFKALEIAKKRKKLKQQADIYNEIGLTYSQLSKYNLALDNFENAIRIYNNLSKKPSIELSYVYSDIGFTYNSLKKYNKALEAFKMSLEFAKESKHVETEMENYLYLSDLYGDMKNYKMQTDFLKKHYNIKDSLFANDNKIKLLELENDYQLEKKNVLIAKKEAETLKNKNQRNILIIISLSTILFSIFLSLLFKRIQTKNIEISKQREKLQELNLIKDRLFAILSHDLRNPLAALKTYLSLSHSALDETKKEKYRVLTEDAVTSTSNLLDNLLVWANLQLKNIKPNISSLVINEVLDDVLSNIHPIAYKKNIEFVKNISLENIHSNSSILLIALQNLIINAIKFSYQDSKIFINVFKIENNIVIEIQDTGTGMSQKKIDEIFQAKAAYSLGTSGEKGSGLGLFLTIQLLEKINAKLKIESKEGEGSKISIILV